MKKKEPEDSFYIHPNDTAIFYVYSHDISVRDFWVLVGRVLDVTQKKANPSIFSNFAPAKCVSLMPNCSH